MRLEVSLAGFPIGHIGVHEAFEDSAVVETGVVGKGEHWG